MIVNLSDYIVAINRALDEAIVAAKAKMIEENTEENIKAYSDLTNANVWFNLLINTNANKE